MLVILGNPMKLEDWHKFACLCWNVCSDLLSTVSINKSSPNMLSFLLWKSLAYIRQINISGIWYRVTWRRNNLITIRLHYACLTILWNAIPVYYTTFAIINSKVSDKFFALNKYIFHALTMWVHYSRTCVGFNPET